MNEEPTIVNNPTNQADSTKPVSANADPNEATQNGLQMSEILPTPAQSDMGNTGDAPSTTAPVADQTNLTAPQNSNGETTPNSPPAVTAQPENASATPLQATPPPAKTAENTPSKIRDFLAKARVTLFNRKEKRLTKILELATKKPTITNDDVEKLLKVSHTTAFRYLKTLVRSGKLQMLGDPRNAHYELKK